MSRWSPNKTFICLETLVGENLYTTFLLTPSIDTTLKFVDMDIKDAGHLTTKSSVFQPTQMGAGGQQEIIRHMSRHYDRVTKAKGWCALRSKHFWCFGIKVMIMVQSNQGQVA